MSHNERDIVPGKRSTAQLYVGRGQPSSPSQRLHPQLGFPMASPEALAQREMVRVSRRTLSPMQSSPGGIAQRPFAPPLGPHAGPSPSKRARPDPTTLLSPMGSPPTGQLGTGTAPTKELFDRDMDAVRRLHSTPEMQQHLQPSAGSVPGRSNTRYILTPLVAVPATTTVTQDYNSTFRSFESAAQSVLSRFRSLNAVDRATEISTMQSLAHAASSHTAEARFIPSVATHRAKIHKLYKKLMSDGRLGQTFDSDYRSVAPDQDEHLSTAMTRHAVAALRTARNEIKGINATQIINHFDEFGAGLLEYLSAHRAPTVHTVFPMKTVAAPDGSRHPTRRGAPPLDGGASAHSYADMQRAAAAAGAFDVAAHHSEGVAAPFVTAMAVAQLNTLNTMSAPLSAVNMSAEYSAQPGVDKSAQQAAREVTKKQASSNPYFARASELQPPTQPAEAPKFSGASPSPTRGAIAGNTGAVPPLDLPAAVHTSVQSSLPRHLSSRALRPHPGGTQ
jgi:hypothetical protein